MTGRIYQLKAVGDDIMVDITHDGLTADRAYRTSHVLVPAADAAELWIGRRVDVDVTGVSITNHTP